MKTLLILFISMILISGCTMSHEEKINEIMNEYNNPDLPGAALMIIQGGEVIFKKCYGLANVEKKLPITSASNFRLASVTKQFTAMSILKLVERGDLELETTLKDIFSNFPEYGSTITIKNLLQHTSGLIDYEDLISVTATVQVKDNDVLELIMKTDSTYFQPGSQYRYSNTGYALLALMIEKLSGKPFRNFLKDNIFQPIGMDNTIAFERDINEVTNRAYGYTVKNNTAEFTDQSITSAVLGDGGIYSSLNDLYKWDQALYTGKLLNEKYLTESWTRGKTSNEVEFPYGYGWRLEKYHNVEVVYHTGSTRGFRNIIYRMPEKKFTILILTNRDSGSEFQTLVLAHKIVDYFIQ